MLIQYSCLSIFSKNLFYIWGHPPAIVDQGKISYTPPFVFPNVVKRASVPGGCIKSRYVYRDWESLQSLSSPVLSGPDLWWRVTRNTVFEGLWSCVLLTTLRSAVLQVETKTATRTLWSHIGWVPAAEPVQQWQLAAMLRNELFRQIAHPYDRLLPPKKKQTPKTKSRLICWVGVVNLIFTCM